MSARFHSNSPCDPLLITQFESTWGTALPQSYAEFLCQTNGGVGFLKSGQYAVLWRLEDLFKLNELYQTREYAPGLLLFGSNGGGEALAFDQRTPGQSVVRVPFIGLDLTLAESLADDFRQLIDDLPSQSPADQTGERPPEDTEILEVQPIILGGSPTDPANKVMVPREKHIAAVRYWNNLIRSLRQQQR